MRIVHLAGTIMLLALFFCPLDAALAQGGAQGGAQAGGQGQASDAARQACTPDAMRLCSDVIPDVARVTACMKAKYKQLSEPCRVAMRGEAASRRHHGHYHHHHRHHSS